jgi:hypothetical protein
LINYNLEIHGLTNDQAYPSMMRTKPSELQMVTADLNPLGYDEPEVATLDNFYPVPQFELDSYFPYNSSPIGLTDASDLRASKSV